MNNCWMLRVSFIVITAAKTESYEGWTVELPAVAATGPAASAAVAPGSVVAAAAGVNCCCACPSVAANIMYQRPTAETAAGRKMDVQAVASCLPRAWLEQQAVTLL